MTKVVFGLLALLLSAGAAWAGDDGLDHYYDTYPCGVRGYTSGVVGQGEFITGGPGGGPSRWSWGEAFDKASVIPC